MRSLLLSAFLLLPLPAFAQVSVQLSLPGVRVVGAPPPPRVEVQTVRPSANHVWIAGHWAFRAGRTEWVPGHWAMAPGAGYVWEPARWSAPRWVWEPAHWEGHGHWRRFVPGHWRPPLWGSGPQ